MSQDSERQLKIAWPANACSLVFAYSIESEYFKKKMVSKIKQLPDRCSRGWCLKYAC